MNPIPRRLSEIVEEFQWGEGRDKLELLLYYAERLPALPDGLELKSGDGELVHECMTPVYVAAEVVEGGMQFYFDVPPESPTVRGFASILAEGLGGATPNEVLQVPNDFYLQMGLQGVLTSQRLNGMAAMLAHIKRLATQALE